MRTLTLSCALVAALTFACSLCAEETSAPKWETIFDGKTLAGWIGNFDYWRVQDAAITGEIPDGKALGKNEFIYWDKGEVADFELSVEYRISGLPSANSGIQIRSKRRSEKPDDWQAVGYQADLDDGAVWLGRIYEEEARGMIAERGTRVSIAPDGRRWVDPYPFATPESFRRIPKKEDWNLYEVSARGPHIETRINGVLFTVLDDHQINAAKYAGKLAFQLHSGKGPSKIEFRNIRIKYLGRTEVPSFVVPPLGGKTPESKTPPETSANAEPPKGGTTNIVPLGANGKALNLNFETGTLDNWKATGDAFEGQPINGDTVSRRKPGERSNHAGQYWIGGYEKVADKGTGTLTSDSFEVAHPYASFLVGGGSSNATRVEIVAEDGGKIIDKASGKDIENMSRHVVDLREWKGKRIFIRLVDEAKGGWGHINFDDFVFHDAAPVFPSPLGGEGLGVRGKGTRESDSPVLWQLRPNPLKPATPPAKKSGAEVVASFSLVNGFQAELVAEEPAITQPIAFTFDERGRLWVVQAMSYPQKQPEGKGKDSIIIFEDTTGSGKFDKRTVFIEGLNLVSGIEVGFGGVWVGAAPQLLFIPDKNHDDVPDGPPEVLLDGFGYQDTHETLNSFIWGPDGWLYGNQGVFNTAFIGKPGTAKKDRTEMHAAVWRYHPIRHEFEIFAHGGSNQWGLDYDSHGNFFMTHCRSFYGGGQTTYVIRNGHYWNQSDSNHAPFICNKAPAFAPWLKNYLPASSTYDDGTGGAGKRGTDEIYGGHAHSGTMIYGGDNWPEIYRDHIFTLNLFGAQMNHIENVRDGSGFESMQGGYDMLHTNDPTYLGVSLKYGPDGAVYILDWCDLQHCHLPNPEKWDKTNGRIYRVSWAATYKPVKVDLGKMSDVELAKLQTHRNEWYARTARRLLMERAQNGKIDQAAIAFLSDMFGKSAETDALRAMWTLYDIGATEQGPLFAFRNPIENANVMGWWVRLDTEHGRMDVGKSRDFVTLAKSESSAMVRLSLASAQIEFDDATRWQIAEALAMHAEDKDDRFLPKMIWYGIAPLVEKNIERAFALAGKTPMPVVADSIYWYACRFPEGREHIATELALGKIPDDGLLHLVQLFSFGLSDQARVAMPKAWPAAAQRLQSHPNAEARALAEQLSALFGDAAILTKMRTMLSDEKTPAADRRRAFDLLKRNGDIESLPAFASLLDNNEFRAQVIPLLARSTDAAVADALLKRLAAFNDADRAAALNSLSANPKLAMALLQAVESKSVDQKTVSAFYVRQMLNLNNAEVAQRVEKVWGKITESPAEMKATIARLKKTYSEAPLWAYDTVAGKRVFEKSCATCHALSGTGGNMGPDLGAAWRNGVDYFLENIVDPNAVVGENYRLHVVKKTDGTVVSGMFEKETDTTLVIRKTSPIESAVIPKNEIKDHRVMPQSVMPAGLLEAMPEREVIELLKYLTTKR
ncbi:MAG TPA: PVC-type heme-binding CxxCH protein [Planctomycetota bacterium]|nr:PVC-type heme-binding CxxCH protein [Planctomycetota bacterium]